MADPQLVLGQQHSTNPLVTAPARARQILLALGLGLVYAVAAYVLLVLALILVGTIVHRLSADGVSIEIPDPLQHSWLVIILYGPAAFFAWRQVTRSARRRASRCEIGPDRLVLVSGSGGESREIDLAGLGSIELNTPGRIELVCGPDEVADRFAVDLPAAAAEDEFENVEAYLDEHAPDALRSIVAGEESRYSRRWTWSDVFAWQEPTLRVSYDRGADGEGRRVVDTGAHQLAVDGDAVCGPAGDLAFRVGADRIVDARGMVLARIEREVFETSLESGCGERLTVQRADSSVRLGGVLIGGLTTRWAVTTLSTDRPLPEPLAVMLVMCWDG